jgi:glycosyltransferase involved in cell wall biosynthesis
MGKITVVSAINIVDGGALTVLQDALIAFDSNIKAGDSVIFLVASPVVHDSLNIKNIKFFYFPKSKKNWLFRVFYEYFYFYFLSLRIQPNIWFSLHDTTPTVKASKRFVYCHNPSIFLKFPLSSISLDPKQFLFSKFYKYLYRINIKKNTSVITQQAWMADEFSRIFNVKNVLVAEPDVNIDKAPIEKNRRSTEGGRNFTLFYPAYPRFFKNHSIIFKAQHLISRASFWLTITGSENKYAKKLVEQYPLINIELLGLLSRSRVFELYQECDALIFPSLLETWGLPLTEFKAFNKPIVAADLPYAHETIGLYEHIYWFDPESPESLAAAIERAKENKKPDSPKTKQCLHKKTYGWEQLAIHIMES